AELKEGHKAFVVLGDMLELGDEEIELHRRLGAQAASVADYLYLMGNLTKNTAQTAAATGMTEANIMQAENHAEIAQHIVSKATAGDLILIKGSRGMKMEQVAQEIRQLASQEN
ncbi:MAG: UDP-N-acetylmuramoyl-tripeptide--D-alanyl-D-alanine ligase, partial [Trichlorobacter sp.]|nr:UDP-N-acetylmuramoyl-tripeptide--D-alanyl-D-alanine ligase [Trichlorobacter sp.]